jgi:23S rRNA (adenine-N6)-dimethyltransferase
VVEIGAGTGRLTEALAQARARVVAVELDPAFAETLRRRFRTRHEVRIVEADILRFPLPRVPFRAFGNVPFDLTTPILRRLVDNPASMLAAADLIVQHEVARKRAAAWPSTRLSLAWQPWWEFRLTRRLPRLAFEPAPSVDAGMLSIARRDPPLIPLSYRTEYLQLLAAAFRQAGWPIHRSLRGRLPERAWKRAARDRGLSPGATAGELDVFDWAAATSLIAGSEGW